MSTVPPPAPDPQFAATPDVPFAQSASPLDEMQFLILRQAVIRLRPIRWAARVARASAWTILVIGLGGWPVLLYAPSLSGLVVVAGICGVGAMEYIGAAKMRRADRSAPTFLARNQLIFVLLIGAYCVHQMLTFKPDEFFSSPQVKKLLDPSGDLGRSVLPLLVNGFYCLVMFLSAICQGCLALYYITRRRHVNLFERETPAWVKRIVAEVES